MAQILRREVDAHEDVLPADESEFLVGLLFNMRAAIDVGRSDDRSTDTLQDEALEQILHGLAAVESKSQAPHRAELPGDPRREAAARGVPSDGRSRG